MTSLTSGFRSAMGALVALTLAGAVAPAGAMNREGHDDWMKDFPPGIEAFESGEDHKPLPSPRCPVSWDTVRANPYEQIPLPRHGCGPAPTAKPRESAR